MTSKALELGEPYLSKDQKSVVDECIERDKFGLSLKMGSGKTLISLIVALKKKALNRDEEPFLVIASKTLISSWETEIKKFFGDSLPYQILKNDEKFVCDKKTLMIISTSETAAKVYKDNEISEKFVIKEKYEDDSPFVRTKNSYTVPNFPFINNPEDTSPSIVFSKKWSSLIVDEAHKYTKITTNRCQSIGAICSKNRMLLSGTLFDEPELERIFGYYIMIQWPRFPRDLPEARTLFKSREFKGTNKTIVTRENFKIPDIKVNKTIVEHDLNIYEARIYTSMKNTLQILKDHLKTANIDAAEKKKFSTYILAMIGFLRQGIVVPIIPIANIAVEMTEMKDSRSDLSVILHNQFNKLNIEEFLENENSAKSSRIKKVISTLEKHDKPTDKTIVFSCFRTSLDVLRYYVEKELDVEIFNLESSMSVPRRGKLVDDFTNSEKNSVLFTTYELGAEGLNLQSANTVIILDFWWNTSKHEQGISRIVRHGQKSSEVNVYFYTSNTGIEKSLFMKHQDKIVCLNEIKTGPMMSSVKSLTMNEILKLIDSNENARYLRNY